MKYCFYLIAIFLISSCGDKSKNNTVVIPTSTMSYYNACCCNTIFNVGIGKIFIPSMFTPNGDGINDIFRIVGDSNINYITNVVITDSANSFTKTIDTMYTKTNYKSWDGFKNTTNIHEGNFTISFKVVDNTNTVTNYSGNSSSYIKTVHANSYISNYANCKFGDQLDVINFGVPYVTFEPNFQ